MNVPNKELSTNTVDSDSPAAVQNIDLTLTSSIKKKSRHILNYYFYEINTIRHNH